MTREPRKAWPQDAVEDDVVVCSLRAWRSTRSKRYDHLSGGEAQPRQVGWAIARRRDPAGPEASAGWPAPGGSWAGVAGAGWAARAPHPRRASGAGPGPQAPPDAAAGCGGRGAGVEQGPACQRRGAPGWGTTKKLHWGTLLGARVCRVHGGVEAEQRRASLKPQEQRDAQGSDASGAFSQRDR